MLDDYNRRLISQFSILCTVTVIESERRRDETKHGDPEARDSHVLAQSQFAPARWTSASTFVIFTVLIAKAGAM
jgi:hypothetical protein